VKFGPVPVAEAEGAILAHGVRARPAASQGPSRRPADVAALEAAGIHEIVAARWKPGDLSEDEAAARLGRALNCSGVRIGEASTGRVNIHAEQAGLLRVNAPLIDAFNLVDPSITIATLERFRASREGRTGGDRQDHPLRAPRRAGRGSREGRRPTRHFPSRPSGRTASVSSRARCPARRRACSTRPRG
jgi:molybdenum cofactor cytidylyltransferase